MPGMRTDEQRGAFGVWLREERTGRSLSKEQVLADLARLHRFRIAPSTYASLESGSRKPTPEQRQQLIAFFGSEPPPVHAPADMAELVSALRELVDVLRLQVEGQSALLMGMASAIADLRAGAPEGDPSRTSPAGAER